MSMRIFDIFFSSIGLFFLSPLFLITMILIKLDSEGPVFFRQERVGKGMRNFKIYKFRTMINKPSSEWMNVTTALDARITRIGRVLRKWKIDELPQLINVLLGEMSLVGPRPEVPRYVRYYTDEQKKVFSVKPGITSMTSLEYIDESEQLVKAGDPESFYITIIIPKKINEDLAYIGRMSVLSAVSIILRTIIKTVLSGLGRADI